MFSRTVCINLNRLEDILRRAARCALPIGRLNAKLRFTNVAIHYKFIKVEGDEHATALD
jgi:hypothetical protein